MGNQALTARSNGQTITESWYDDLARALAGDLYPRSSDSTPTNIAAALGSALKRWKRLNAASGEYTAGSMKFRLSYNGLVSPGRGWMLCDGRQINRANYDAEWGEGSWDDDIVASPLEDKYLPPMVNRYAVGAASVAQDGSVALTPVGNVDHQTLRHNHQWYESNGSGSNDGTGEFDVPFPGIFGSSFGHAFGSKSTGKTLEQFDIATTAAPNPPPNSYTDMMADFDIKPRSIPVLWYMRII